jgi:hypothetical protein
MFRESKNPQQIVIELSAYYNIDEVSKSAKAYINWLRGVTRTHEHEL